MASTCDGSVGVLGGRGGGSHRQETGKPEQRERDSAHQQPSGGEHEGGSPLPSSAEITK